MEQYNPSQESKEAGTEYPPEKSTVYKQKQFGRNVEVHVYIMRHSERPLNEIAPEVKLTENGRSKCMEFGANLNKKLIVGAECSPARRTKETAKIVVLNSPTTNRLSVRERNELSSHSSPEFRERVKLHVKRILGPGYDLLPQEEKNQIDILSTVAGIKYYLAYGDRRPDPQTYSPVETAASVALRLEPAIRKINRLHSGTTADFFLSTHDYVIAAFLQQVLLQKTKEGTINKGFTIDKLGDDTIAFLENIEFVAKTDNEGKKTVQLKFRDSYYEIDEGRLRELVRIGTKLKESELRNSIRTGRNKTDEEVMQEEITKRLGDKIASSDL